MMMLSVLAAGLLGVPSLAAPTQPPLVWTVSDFNRICSDDGVQCNYSFKFDEHSGQGDATYCAFPVSGLGGSIPGSQKPFQAVACHQDDIEDRFRINGGWDSNGFLTIVVSDLDKNAHAFFGFLERELSSPDPIEDKNSPALNIGTYTPYVGEAYAGESNAAGDDEDVDAPAPAAVKLHKRDEQRVAENEKDPGLARIMNMIRCMPAPPSSV